MKARRIFHDKTAFPDGYDNEQGKGDHRHLAGVESPYPFVSVEQMIEDFLADVWRVNGELGE